MNKLIFFALSILVVFGAKSQTQDSIYQEYLHNEVRLMVLEAITDSVKMTNTIKFPDYSLSIIHDSVLIIQLKHRKSIFASLDNYGWLIRNEKKGKKHGVQLFHKTGFLLVEFWKRGKIKSRSWIDLGPID